MHEWMTDNGHTPHIVVDTSYDGVTVPEEHVKDGKIVLNLGPNAVEALSIGNQEVSFMARFGGVAQQLSIPIAAVLAIYARENGRGMMFSEEEPGPEPDDSGPKPTRPSLKVVK